MRPIIRVENLGKEYTIGHRDAPYATLRESLTKAARAPFARARQAYLNARNSLSPQPPIPNPQPLGASPQPPGFSRPDRFWALKDVSFEVQPGEVVGIIGRNGAGKSTLLKILSRITEPTTGSVDLYGRVGSLLEVGTGFHPELTGRENIYLNGAILGMSRREIDRRFDEIVDFAEVEKFIDTPVKRYSSGMYLRLAFAVAANLQTELLIVDEVLAVGDSGFQKKCLGKMGDVARTGRTVLFVSHNMAAITSLCKLAIQLEHGHLKRSGAVEKVVRHYANNTVVSNQRRIVLTHNDPLSKSIITEVELRSSDSNPSCAFFPDDALELILTVEPHHAIRSPRLAMAIEDAYGRRLTTCASFFSTIPMPDIDGHKRIRCTIPRTQLAPGRYLLSVSIGTKDTWLECLDNIAAFQIDWRNNYGNNEPYRTVYGPILTDSCWEILN